MARRSYSAIFLDILETMSEGGTRLVGNKSLRQALGWDIDRYDRIKSHLLDEGRLIVGRGKYGAVGLASVQGSGVSVFLSYSHEDESLKESLLKHLAPLERMGLIDNWHDRLIKPGEEWKDVIDEKLLSSDLMLLLVSVDFINSSYCFEIEMETAIEQHAAGRSRVIPVILRNCLWQYTPFAKLQALPKDGKAVTAWLDRDEALTSVSEGIRQVAQDILATRD